MKRLISVFLLLSTLFFAVSAQKRPVRKARSTRPSIKGDLYGNPTPPPPTVAAMPKTAGLTIERYVSNYDINSDGTAKQIWEMQQRCDSAICLQRAKNLKFVFNGDITDYAVLDAFILKKNGTKQALPSTASRTRPTPLTEAAPAFSSLKEFEIDFEQLDLGDSAYFKIEIATKKPIFDHHFDSLELFPLIFDWRSIEINVTAPTDYVLYADATGLEGGKLPSENGRSRWQWKKQNGKAIPLETYMLDPLSRSPRFAITSFRSYDDLAAAYWNGMKEKAVVTPEIQRLADEITKGIAEPGAQASAIYGWVNKNIRYLSVVLDRGGWIPHSSKEIIENGYGDCKDYTTLIYTLMKAKGLESVPVLIRAEAGSWFPEVASMDYFNHAILYVPGLKLFADATTPNTRLGIIPQQIVGKKALLAGEKTGIIEVPQNNPDDNQLLSDVDIAIEQNGRLKAISKNTYAGRAEMIFRPMFGESGILKHSDGFVKTLLSYMGMQGTGRMLEVSDPYTVGEAFTVRMEVELPDYTTFTPRGNISLPIGINMMNPAMLEAFTREEKRETDLVVGAIRFREKFRVKLPHNVSLGNLPEPIALSNVVGSYNLAFGREAGAVSVVRELVLHKDIVTPAEYQQFRDLVAKTRDGLVASFDYTADPGLLRAKSLELRTKPRPDTSLDDNIGPGLEFWNEKKLTAVDVKRLEAKVKADPDDLGTRSRLLRHYYDRVVVKISAVNPARFAHRLWFVKNKPEMERRSILGWRLYDDDKNSSEYAQLRDEWLRQIAADKTNAQIRLNAVEFFGDIEPEVTAKVLREGMEADPSAFEFPTMLTDRYLRDRKNLGSASSASARSELNKRILETGATALKVLKSERSDARDTKRSEILIGLCPITIEAGDMRLAESLAKELILDFGDNPFDPDFQTGTHVGNITLGHVELARGNVAKAGEHLLISIRAPLRRDTGYFNDIDTGLAKALYKKGEAKSVAEYLKLCLGLSSFKTDALVHEKKIKAMRSWLAMIENGTEPTFDFGKP